MQFASKEDIEAPIEAVFATLCDFEAFERSAIRRGADVVRLHDVNPVAAGMKWQARFPFRGRTRDLQVTLQGFEAPTAMEFRSDSDGLDVTLTIDLVALSPKRTRLAVVLNIKPKTLSARLLVQSLKLAKSNLTKRFKLKVADYAKLVEDRHARAT